MNHIGILMLMYVFSANISEGSRLIDSYSQIEYPHVMLCLTLSAVIYNGGKAYWMEKDVHICNFDILKPKDLVQVE